MAEFYQIPYSEDFIALLLQFLHDNGHLNNDVILFMPGKRSIREFKRQAAEKFGASCLPSILSYSEVLNKAHLLSSQFINTNNQEPLTDHEFFALIAEVFPDNSEAAITQIQNFLVEFYSFHASNKLLSNPAKQNIISKMEAAFAKHNVVSLQQQRNSVGKELLDIAWKDKPLYAVFPLNNTSYANSLLAKLASQPRCKILFHGPVAGNYCYQAFLASQAAQVRTLQAKTNLPAALEVRYFSGNNLYQTAIQISYAVREFFACHQSSAAIVALITEDSELAKFCSRLTRRWKIIPDDAILYDLKNDIRIKKLLILLEFARNASIEVLTNLLTLFDFDIIKFITTKAKYPNISLHKLMGVIERQNLSPEISVFYRQLQTFVKQMRQQQTMQQFWQHHVNFFTEHCTDIDAAVIAELGQKITVMRFQHTPITLARYLDIFNRIITKHQARELESYSRFLILSPIEARLLKFSRVIIASCHFGLGKSNRSYMLEKQALAEKIDLEHITNCHAECDVKHLVASNEVLIVQNKSKDLYLHPLLEQLVVSGAAAHEDKYSHWLNVRNDLPSHSRTQPQVACTELPKKLTPTSVELYMYNPYLFYAKYILRLFALEDEGSLPQLFGIICHKIIATIKQPFHTVEALEQFMQQQLEQELANYHIEDEWIKKLWQQKITAIAESLFSKYAVDSQREFKISYSYRNFTFEATIDELVVNGNCLEIIDYKTGSLPTKYEVNSGAKPQLLIEQFIVHTLGTYQNCQLEYRQINPPLFAEQQFSFELSEITSQIDIFVDKMCGGYFTASRNNAYNYGYQHLLRYEEWQYLK